MCLSITPAIGFGKRMNRVDLKSEISNLKSDISPGLWLPVASLWWREVVRFYRQPSRIIGGLGSPLVFWVLIGSGIGSSFRNPTGVDQMRYLEYFFPGTLALILLFTPIF